MANIKSVKHECEFYLSDAEMTNKDSGEKIAYKELHLVYDGEDIKIKAVYKSDKRLLIRVLGL